MQNTPTVEVLAYEKGRRAGLAIAAVAVASMAFIQLLGFEKALLGTVLAVLAMRGAKNARTERWSRMAIVIAVLYVVVAVSTIILLHDTFIELVHLLQKLG